MTTAIAMKPAVALGEQIRTRVQELVKLSEQGCSALDLMHQYDDGYGQGYARAQEEIASRPTAHEVLLSIAGYLEASMPSKAELDGIRRAERLRLIALCHELADRDEPLSFHAVTEVISGLTA